MRLGFSFSQVVHRSIVPMKNICVTHARLGSRLFFHVLNIPVKAFTDYISQLLHSVGFMWQGLQEGGAEGL